MMTQKSNYLTKILTTFLVLVLTFTQPCYADDVIDDTVNAISDGYGAFIVGALGIAGAALSTSLLNNKHTKNNKPAFPTNEITVNNINFTGQGTQTLTLTNTATQLVTINTVTLQNIKGIKLGDYSTCQSLNPNESCKIPLTASADAYGNGQVVVSYIGDIRYSGPKEATANVTVKETTLTITPATTNIVLEKNVPQSFTYKNIGPFAWQNPTISWKNNLAGVSIATDNCSGATSIAPGASCSFQITASETAIPGNSGILSTTGNNITQLLLDVIIDGVAIIKNPELHLGYGAIQVVNTTTNTLNPVISINLANINNNKTKICASTDYPEVCRYKTTCVTNGSPTQLPSGNSCSIWFQAMPTTDSLNTETTILSVNAAGWSSIPNTPPTVGKFSIKYEQALYVGGGFTSAENISAASIAKWDGSAWSNIGNLVTENNINDTVFTITAIDGDLYAGGLFQSAGGVPALNIAKWNGSTWSNLGSGIGGFGNDMVLNILDTYKAGSTHSDIYAGGRFSFPAKSIAKWDGSVWSNLGTGVTAGSMVETMANFGNYLYVGGLFSKFGTVLTNSLAKWDYSNSTWSSEVLPTGTGIHALINVNNILYAGGHFSSIGGTAASNIAKWNGSAWSHLGSGISGGNIQAIAGNNNNIYAGGTFTSAGEITAKNIAKWDNSSSSWSALGSGIETGSSDPLNPAVYAIASSNNTIYVGGNFLSAGGKTAKHIAAWSCSQPEICSWSEVGNGVNDVIYALAIIPSLSITAN